jgi:SiaC family regulatory phosphoprotein
MEPLYIRETPETPGVVLDKEKGIFELKGRSISDDPTPFYNRVGAWITEYALAPNSRTMFRFTFQYINIESSRSLLDLLHLLQHIKGIEIEWHFSHTAEDIKEMGENLSALVPIPFQLVPMPH